MTTTTRVYYPWGKSPWRCDRRLSLNRQRLKEHGDIHIDSQPKREKYKNQNLPIYYHRK
jgi:hypothetical protein